MSGRKLITLGTSSQVPTRHRNHNGYLLRWDDEAFLFDPGEGTQRQITFAGVAPSVIHRVFITHFHGDHCLGLAGIVQRLSLDRVQHPIHIHYPASGQVYFDRLRAASIFHLAVEIVPRPFQPQSGLFLLDETERYTLMAHALDHDVPCFGYRVQERAGRRMLPEKLAALGITGAAIGELQRTGVLQRGESTVRLEDVSVPRYGSSFAFVMDTRMCPGAIALCNDADLAVVEATYNASDQALATDHGHMSSVDAARVAAESKAHALAITHFSQRYHNVDEHLNEARALFPKTIALHDLVEVDIPRRRTS